MSGAVNLTDLTVAASDTYCLDPNASTTVTLTGNLIVYGRLEAKPANATVTHTIRWTGVNENGFAGGGDVPIASDPGLWVQGAGVLDLAGTTRVPWNRTGTDPSWLPSDETVSTPITANNFTTFPAFVQGSAVPFATSPTGTVHKAEILNLTRNVRIEGTATGRAHIHIKSTAPQSIRNVALRYLGPRRLIDSDAHTDPIPGRQSLHMHRNGDGSRGTLIENVVARDSGGMGFDIHDSHGVTLRGDISYGTNENGFGWTVLELSNDTLIEGSIAAKQVPIPNFRGYALTGFALSPGSGNTIRDSVAVGNLGNSTGSGVLWPEMSISVPNVWVASDVTSHNNKMNGVYAWQNSNGDHVVDRFVCFLNGKSGVEHGAYQNHYTYNDLTTWGNGTAGVIMHAASNVGATGRTLDVNGGRVDGVKIVKHAQAATIPVEFRDTILARPTGKSLVIDETHDGGFRVGWNDFYRTGIEPADVQVLSMVAGSTVRVQRTNGTAFRVNADGTTTEIPPFG